MNRAIRRRARNELPRLTCSLCFYVPKKRIKDAVTIINGQAVCYDHMGYVGGGAHRTALSLLQNR